MKRIEAESLPPIVALKAIRNGALGSDDLPARIKVLNWGTNESTKGHVTLDNQSIAALAANQRRLGFDRVALDFEHNTVPGSIEYERSQEPRRVAAYGTPVVVPGDGLFLENLEWTPVGRAEAKNFADLSPAPSLDAGGRVTFLHSVALVRNGAVHDLSFFSASTNPPKTNMPESITITEFASALGLKAEATKEDVLAKLKTLTALTALDPIVALVKDGKIVALSALETRVEGIAEQIKTIEAAKVDGVVTFSADVNGKPLALTPADVVTRIAALESQLATFTAAGENAEKARVISLFAAEGKVPMGEDAKPMNEDALKALPLGVLKMLHASTPVTVPLTARGKKPGNEKESLKGMDAVRAAIREGLQQN